MEAPICQPESNEGLLQFRTALSLEDAESELRCQFERLGYFALDKDSQLSTNRPQLVFNRTITLKDTWAKEAQKSCLDIQPPRLHFPLP